MIIDRRASRFAHLTDAAEHESRPAMTASGTQLGWTSELDCIRPDSLRKQCQDPRAVALAYRDAHADDIHTGICPRLRSGGSWGEGLKLIIQHCLQAAPQDSHTEQRDTGRCPQRAATAAQDKPTALCPCCSSLLSLETAHGMQARSNTHAVNRTGCGGLRRCQTPQSTRPSAAGRGREACSEARPGLK